MMVDTLFDHEVLNQGPSFHIDLAALDALHPVHYSRRLLIFRCSSLAQRESQLASLKTGLQGLVQRCPILGGIIGPPPVSTSNNGFKDWRTILPGPGLELVVRDLREEMPSFHKLETAHFSSTLLPYDLLVPVPQDISNDAPYAACKLQFSTIEGGTIITFAMSHSVADGSGTNELLRILSQETRLAQEHRNRDLTDDVTSKATEIDVIGLDRTVLRNMTSEIPFNIKHHPGYRWKTDTNGLENPSSDFSAPAQPETQVRHPFEAVSPGVPILLRISATKLAQLKADASQPNSPPISTHDALTALVWRSVIFIRSHRQKSDAVHLPPSTMTQFFMPSDARRHLNLPTSYIGNAVYQLAAFLDLGTLLSSNGLQHAASAVRHAITSVKPSLVQSYMATVNKVWVNWQFEVSYSTTGVPMGTDWTSSELFTQDWGEAFGPLIRYRYPNEEFNVIMPKLLDGSAEVVISVLPEEVDILKGEECWGRYIEAD